MKLGIPLPHMGGGTAEEIARVAVRAELADGLVRFEEIDMGEILVTPIGADRGLEKFLDRFDAEVTPHVNIH